MNTITEPTASSEISKPRRRWFQFSLRTLFVIVLIVCCGAAYLNSYLFIVRQREAKLRLNALDCSVHYDYEMKYPSTKPGPRWRQWLFGEDANARVVFMNCPEYSKIQNEDLGLLADLPYVNQIHLHGAKFGDQTIETIAKSRSEILSLDLEDLAVTSKGAPLLLSFQQLESISLAGSAFNDEFFQIIVKLPRLKSLMCVKTTITPDTLALVSSMKDLKTLVYRGPHAQNQAPIDDSWLHHLSDLKKLEILSLTETQITDRGLEHIARLNSLGYIALDSSPVNGSGFDQFARLSALDHVSLENTLEDDQGVAKLVGAVPRLIYLYLTNTKITDSSIEELVKFKELQRLHIDKCNISETALKKLSQLKTLRYLHIGTGVSEKTVQEMYAKMPECRIVSDKGVISRVK